MTRSRIPGPTSHTANPPRNEAVRSCRDAGSAVRVLGVLLACATLLPGPRLVGAQHGTVTAPFTEGLSTPESLRREVEGRLTRARTLLETMLSVSGTRTVVNTLAPYDELAGEIFTASAQAAVIAALHPDEAMRRAADELNRTVSAFAAQIPLHADVYRALAAIETRALDALTQYYLQRELKEFRLAGVDQPEATRQRLRELRSELAGLSDVWIRNIQTKPRQVPATAAELEGLPADFVARHTSGRTGAVVLTSDLVDQRPVLMYARSADLRRRMLLAAGNVAAPDNVPVLERILQVRREIASLLGYPNWASYDAASRMAGDVSSASAFIDRVVAASGPRAERELEQLTRRKQQDFPDSTLNLWDRQYYSELVRRASYDFDSQAVRPYFPFAAVLDGVLKVTGTIFSVTYRPASNVPAWHPSVRVYEVFDGDTFLGRVYLDLHPRRNKRASANMATVRYGQRGRSVPEVVLSASLPGGEPGDPGLMTHEDVRTLFHEFGHVVHRLSGGHQPWQKLSSIAIERDFAEVPSQLLEEWIWDPPTLAAFARHYQTGTPIPAELVRQMRRASEFGQGLDARQQMVLARVALTYHERQPGTFDLTSVWKEIHDRYVAIPFLEGTVRAASFPHLGQADYASAYYTYMWSLVIAKDLFSRFEGQALTTAGLGREYRMRLLQAGSSRPAAALVEDFLGRPFSSQAWERWLNN